MSKAGIGRDVPAWKEPWFVIVLGVGAIVGIGLLAWLGVGFLSIGAGLVVVVIAIALVLEVRSYRMRPATAAIIATILVIGLLLIKGYCPTLWSVISTGHKPIATAQASQPAGPAKHLFEAQPPIVHEIGSVDCKAYAECNLSKPLPVGTTIYWEATGKWTFTKDGRTFGWFGLVGDSTNGEIGPGMKPGAITIIKGGEGGVTGLTFSWKEPVSSLRQLNPAWVAWCQANECGDPDAPPAAQAAK